MGMIIKDPAVHAMARELAARRGTTVTDAVRQALRAELEKTTDLQGPIPMEARKTGSSAICSHFRARPE